MCSRFTVADSPAVRHDGYVVVGLSADVTGRARGGGTIAGHEDRGAWRQLRTLGRRQEVINTLDTKNG